MDSLMSLFETMVNGHLETQKEYGLKQNITDARRIAAYDLKHYICLYDEFGSYVVVIPARRINGDLYAINKVFTPLEYRGLGHISKLFDKCPKPLILLEDEYTLVRG